MKLLPLLLFAAALLPARLLSQNQLPPGTQMPDTAAPAQREAAETKIEQKDFAAARPLLVQYLSHNPTDARALFDLGYVEDAEGHQDAASGLYRKAIAAEPRQFEARMALGLLLAHQGNYQEAREQVQQATLLAPEPPSPEAQAEAFRTLARLDRSADPAAARDALVTALKLSAETPGDLLLTAQIAEANDDTELAQTAYQRLLSGHPAPEPSVAAAATGGLAQLLIKQKKYADAEPLLKSALQRDPHDPALNAQLATALLAQGKNDDALPVLETLRGLEPANAEVDQMLADAYSEGGHPEKAEPIYAGMVLAHPGNEEILLGQGQNLVREKLYPQAQQVFERAVKLKPDDGDAWSGLAFTASENKHYQVAMDALSMRSKYLSETPSTYFLWATTCDSLHLSKQAQDYYRKFLTASDGKFPDQEWQAKHRLVALGGSH